MLHFLMQNSVHFYPQQLLTAESVSQSHSGGITCSRKVCCRVNFVIENFVPSLGHAPLKLPEQLLSCPCILEELKHCHGQKELDVLYRKMVAILCGPWREKKIISPRFKSFWNTHLDYLAKIRKSYIKRR